MNQSMIAECGWEYWGGGKQEKVHNRLIVW